MKSLAAFSGPAALNYSGDSRTITVEEVDAAESESEFDRPASWCTIARECNNRRANFTSRAGGNLTCFIYISLKLSFVAADFINNFPDD